MYISDVLVATDLKPIYYKFIPLFVKAWEKMIPHVNINIILISNNIPSELKEYKSYIKLFPPISNINTAFISQVIRLFYPCIINAKSGIIITDIDMIPMRSGYYINNIKKYSDDKFISYIGQDNNDKQIIICYNVATQKIWKDIFNIKTINDIKQNLINEYKKINYSGKPGTNGWFTDQRLLYNKLTIWNKKTNNFVILNIKDINHRRLNRTNKIILNDKMIHNIRTGYYSDYHALRPYDKYKKINDKIVDYLPNQNILYEFI